jgi:nucleoid-associated protein YgaU
MSTLPPRNVIYYNDGSNPIGLAGIANLPYTDVIIGFLVPDANNQNQLVGGGGAFDSNLQSNVQALRNAGKNVLICLGGATFPSSAWQNFAQNSSTVSALADQIVTNWVIPYGFNGVDIDYEDDSGFTGTYDGIGFLSALTNALYAALPSGQNIITHAPAPGFWDPDSAWQGAYLNIFQSAGDQIAWFNTQFYNNNPYDLPGKTRVSYYKQFAATTGAQKFLVGTPLSSSSLCAGEGYIALPDFIQQVIIPLQGEFGSQFGGVMGWEFAFDQGGTWATGIAQALGTVPPPVLPLSPEQYTVQSGDTLASIAQTFYGDSSLWTLIQNANGIANPEDIQVGQQLQIPFGQQYTVQSGDTLANIAQTLYGNSSEWTLIVDANPGINPNDLLIGQQLQIPFGLQYTVQSGDTLANIAQTFYGDSNQWTLIQNANPTVDPTKLQVGQQLLIQFGQQYAVQSGDTLIRLAEQFYGNGNQSTVIQSANPTVDPNNIPIGQQLTIPAGYP